MQVRLKFLSADCVAVYRPFGDFHFHRAFKVSVVGVQGILYDFPNQFVDWVVSKVGAGGILYDVQPPSSGWEVPRRFVVHRIHSMWS